MPAGLPGDSAADNFGNPNEGNFVIFDALSGPKGSPNDHDGVTLSWDANNHPVYTVGDPQNTSTGGLSTGIGYGSQASPMAAGVAFRTGGSLLGFAGGNFTDDYIPGQSSPASDDDKDSTYVYIGGGRTVNSGTPLYANIAGAAGTDPYDSGVAAICGAGNGGSRDSGANTGFGMKLVTLATGSAANGAVVETGYRNRSGATIAAGQSVFGSAITANTAAS